MDSGLFSEEAGVPKSEYLESISVINLTLEYILRKAAMFIDFYNETNAANKAWTGFQNNMKFNFFF